MMTKKKQEAFRRALQGLKEEQRAELSEPSLFDKEYWAFLEMLAQSEPEAEISGEGDR